MAERLPIAFLAGVVSIAFPCVLPLVPGYLSAVSAVEVERLGERGVAARVARTSIPFVLGFTAVFVALGAGAAALGGIVNANRRVEIAGFVLVASGLAFVGLLPWPERLLGAGLLTRARGSGSRALLGGGFAVCAAGCIGPVLASILVVAGNTGTILRGALLLTAYSAGIAAAFVLLGIAFARALAAFRFVRDHYGVVRVGSGAMLVVLGLLLFFHRDWWLSVLLNRALDSVGLANL